MDPPRPHFTVGEWAAVESAQTPGSVGGGIGSLFASAPHVHRHRMWTLLPQHSLSGKAPLVLLMTENEARLCFTC